MSSVPAPDTTTASPHTALPTGEVRLGHPDLPLDYRALIGYCTLGSPDTSLLLSLLPQVVLVRGDRRLTLLVALVGEEARHPRPGKDLILSHLLEVLFIEALRSTAAASASPGLLRGLADERIAPVLRRLHASPERGWTIETLAREVALSRSTFFDRFRQTVGIAPMAYLLAWRMALAKDLLRDRGVNIAGVADRIGYSSANTFSTAFKRCTGQSPAQYARRRGDSASDPALGDRLGHPPTTMQGMPTPRG